MNTPLPQHAVDALAAEKVVIDAGHHVRDTRGASEACDAYDAVQVTENEVYEAMNVKGLTRDQWAAFDRARLKMYRGAEWSPWSGPHRH